MIKLAVLVLLSTVSLTIEKHYCGANLVDIAVFSEVKNCAMESVDMLQNMGCCKHEVDVITGQNQLKVTFFEDLDLEEPQFVTTNYFNCFINFQDLARQTIPQESYMPPRLVADIQVLDQVFII